jgi:hypothetical protein
MYRGVELHSVHAPGISRLADRIHERCGEEKKEAGHRLKSEAAAEAVVIRGGKGVEGLRARQKGRRNAVWSRTANTGSAGGGMM